MKNIKLTRVVVEHRYDYGSDTRYLGEYSERPSGWYVDREAGELRDSNDTVLAENIHTSYSDGEYQYISGFQHPSSWEHVTTANVCKAWLKSRAEFRKYGIDSLATTRSGKIHALEALYCVQDAERLEAANRGDFCYLGIIAKAEVAVSGVVQRITSGGLWGVESDSGEDYIGEVEAEELAQLAEQLAAIGVGKQAIKRAIQRKEVVER